jgi:hypothetical protein
MSDTTAGLTVSGLFSVSDLQKRIRLQEIELANCGNHTDVLISLHEGGLTAEIRMTAEEILMAQPNLDLKSLRYLSDRGSKQTTQDFAQASLLRMYPNLLDTSEIVMLCCSNQINIARTAFSFYVCLPTKSYDYYQQIYDNTQHQEIKDVCIDYFGQIFSNS